MIPRPDVDREGPLWGKGGHCRWRRRRSAKGRTLPLDLGPANGRSRRVSLVAPRPREGPLTEPIAGTEPRPQERVLMPHTCRSRYPPGSAQLGGYLPLAPGVSAVRYPISQRTFQYVATVQAVTDETCHKRT